MLVETTFREICATKNQGSSGDSVRYAGTMRAVKGSDPMSHAHGRGSWIVLCGLLPGLFRMCHTSAHTARTPEVFQDATNCRYLQ